MSSYINIFRVTLDDFHMSDNQVQPGRCLRGGLSISSQETRGGGRVERTGLLCGEKTGLEGNEKWDGNFREHR